MKTKDLVLGGLIQAAAVVAYIFILVWTLFNASLDTLVGQSMLGPLLFLLVFVISAAVMGLLIFGKAVLLYLDTKNIKGALFLVLYTLGWLLLFGVIILLVAAMSSYGKGLL